MKKMICLVLLAVMLSGCASNPKHHVVVSKSDGSFDANVVKTATMPSADITPKVYEYHDQFTSTDESVLFTININESVTIGETPVVEVSPHNLNGEEAKHIAHVLFEDVQYFESDPVLAQTFSKSEIQSCLSTWAKYSNQEAMNNLYGSSSEGEVKLIRTLVERFTKEYESAPDANPDLPCQWVMKKDSYYIYPKEEADRRDTTEDNDKISASLMFNGYPYQYSVSTRNRSDFKINNIHATLAPISPADIDYDILRAQLCRTEKPKDTQLSAAKEKVEWWLSQMNLGDWEIVECKASTQFFGETPEYTIHLQAVPVFCNEPAMYREQLYNLKSEEAYASNYYLTDAKFVLAPNGELISFDLLSPVDVKQVVNENAATLTLDELIERAKDHLMLSDRYQYGLVEGMDEIEESVKCTVNISCFDYGLTRVKAPNTDESYYYVPAITLRGHIEYVGCESNNLYYSSPEDEPVVLLLLNAIDGTIIDHSGV